MKISDLCIAQISCTFGNYLYQWATGLNNWSTALEDSLMQLVALITFTAVWISRDY